MVSLTWVVTDLLVLADLRFRGYGHGLLSNLELRPFWSTCLGPSALLTRPPTCLQASHKIRSANPYVVGLTVSSVVRGIRGVFRGFVNSRHRDADLTYYWFTIQRSGTCGLPWRWSIPLSLCTHSSICKRHEIDLPYISVCSFWQSLFHARRLFQLRKF